MKKKISRIKNSEVLEYNINKAFLGIFALITGLIFLVNNLNIYFIDVTLANFWPLFIVFIGLSLFRKKNITSTIVGSIVTIICVILFFSSIILNTTNNVNLVIQDDPSPVFITKELDTNKAEIELNTGGGKVNVYGIESEKSILSLVTDAVDNEITQVMLGSTQKININLYGENDWTKGRGNIKNNFNVGINKNIPVDFVLSSGGSDDTVDLSEVMAENIRITTAASSLSLKLGNIVSSDVSIEAGASSVNLILPNDVGARIIIDSGFSSQELSGFSLVSENTYQSINYNSKEKKINIEVTMGMANIKVGWYSPVKKNEVSLFYYNQLEDKNNTCNVSYILPVKRLIVESNDQIRDTINLLIKGKLTEKEKSEGFSTGFPNNDFKLLDSSLNDGILTLKFSEVSGFTNGDYCRVKTLGSEIIRTAKQFSEVKKVVFEPSNLFQP
ncbi:MAG: GerMN domain-containing protein [Candidatus Paceibacterota bacterium]|jgi:spore germination protein GerM